MTTTSPVGSPSNHYINFSTQKALRLFDAGYFEQAIELCRDILSAFPENDEIKLLLAGMYRNTGKTEEALLLLGLIQGHSLYYSDALFQSGMILIDNRDLAGGMGCLKSLIKHSDAHVEGHNNLGICLMEMSRYEEAYRHFSRAVQLAPDNAEIYNNIGNLFVRCMRFAEAGGYYKRAIALKADYAGAYNNLGRIASYEGRLCEAVDLFRKALELKPAYRSAADNLLSVLNNSDKHTSEQVRDEHLRLAYLYSTTIDKNAIPQQRRQGGKIRVGYVSADFRNHSVGFFIEPVLNNHCRESFDIFCYDQAALPDETTTRIMKTGWTWREVCRLSDSEMADQIRADAVDILVDLSGHSCGNRLGVFALQPAPIQVTWLGYPNTTGLRQINYRLTDALADPIGTTEHLNSECLVRLPQTFLCYAPPATAPEVAPPPDEPVIFCSFNNYPKVSDTILKLWAIILHAVPDAKLLLKSRPLGDSGVRTRLTQRFGALGIEPTRLILSGFAINSEDHLRLYTACHVALDTFPYNGTTTTCEALWMGVPVVTLAGTNHASRVGTTILHSVGLSELVALNSDQYVDIAVALSKRPDRLKEYRHSLRPRMLSSQLMNAVNFTADLEKAYLKMLGLLRCGDTCLKLI
jgi:predicted O-linked N-acetylglucosamine transferase (SPINDLY family)